MLKLTTDKSTTILGIIAGTTEILIEFNYIDQKIGGIIIGVSLLCWGILTNKILPQVEAKRRSK